MANGCLEVRDKLEFHPCDTPRGSLYYDLKGLTVEQQEKLNELKLKVIREDEVYLADHPEIRAIIVLILRYVFKYQPKRDLNYFIADYFLRERAAINNEIETYLTGRKDHIYRGDSALIQEHESSNSLLDLERLEAEAERLKKREEAETVTTEVLGEIVGNVWEKIEEDHRENIAFIRQLITEEVVEKIGDHFTEDFKAFIIDELVKRISCHRFLHGYEDMTFEDNISEITYQHSNIDGHEQLVSSEIEENQMKETKTDD